MSTLHSLGAGEFCFRMRPARRRSLLRAVEMLVITVALDRNSLSLANGMFERSDALLLRRSCSGHVENFLFHDCAVQIVHAVTKRHLCQGQTQADPISGQMIDVIELNSADIEDAQLLDGRSAPDVSKHRRLRLEGKWNKTAQYLACMPQV